ncbi:ribosomal protein RPS6 [Toxoplasma gondii VAND]|uniref:Ribosomal protein RPS6 n=1 Tax=Toxoplasma gondii VAND TaxID=933077 RepID=A0A086PY56_TOXGO|nr:ribosomal protein RPS6 [Toxoplasma gondii VAND]
MAREETQESEDQDEGDACENWRCHVPCWRRRRPPCHCSRETTDDHHVKACHDVKEKAIEEPHRDDEGAPLLLSRPREQRREEKTLNQSELLTRCDEETKNACVALLEVCPEESGSTEALRRQRLSFLSPHASGTSPLSSLDSSESFSVAFSHCTFTPPELSLPVSLPVSSTCMYPEDPSFPLSHAFASLGNAAASTSSSISASPAVSLQEGRALGRPACMRKRSPFVCDSSRRKRICFLSSLFPAEAQKATVEDTDSLSLSLPRESSQLGAFCDFSRETILNHRGMLSLVSNPQSSSIYPAVSGSTVEHSLSLLSLTRSLLSHLPVGCRAVSGVSLNSVSPSSVSCRRRSPSGAAQTPVSEREPLLALPLCRVSSFSLCRRARKRTLTLLGCSLSSCACLLFPGFASAVASSANRAHKLPCLFSRCARWASALCLSVSLAILSCSFPLFLRVSCLARSSCLALAVSVFSCLIAPVSVLGLLSRRRDLPRSTGTLPAVETVACPSREKGVSFYSTSSVAFLPEEAKGARHVIQRRRRWIAALWVVACLPFFSRPGPLSAVAAPVTASRLHDLVCTRTQESRRASLLSVMRNSSRCQSFAFVLPSSSSLAASSLVGAPGFASLLSPRVAAPAFAEELRPRPASRGGSPSYWGRGRPATLSKFPSWLPFLTLSLSASLSSVFFASVAASDFFVSPFVFRESPAPSLSLSEDATRVSSFLGPPGRGGPSRSDVSDAFSGRRPSRLASPRRRAVAQVRRLPFSSPCLLSSSCGGVLSGNRGGEVPVHATQSSVERGDASAWVRRERAADGRAGALGCSAKTFAFTEDATENTESEELPLPRRLLVPRHKLDREAHLSHHRPSVVAGGHGLAETRLYRVVALFRPELSVPKIKEAVRPYVDQLQQWRCRSLRVTYRGYRRLAYRVKKKDSAHVVEMTFDLLPSAVHYLHVKLNLDDNIIRFMILKNPPLPRSIVKRRHTIPPEEFEELVRYSGLPESRS